MEHAFSKIISLLISLLANVCVYVCEKIITYYDDNRDGKLSPQEFSPATKIVNFINRWGNKEDSHDGR